MKMILRLIFPILMLSLACERTYYVSPDGDDGGAGSKSSPWRSIQTGIDRLEPGDALLVGEGIFSERLIIRDKRGCSDKRIEIRNLPGVRPVIDQSGLDSPAVEVSNCAYLTLSGFEMRDASENCVLIKGSENLLVENNLIHHFLRYGIWIDSGSEIDIRHNELYGVKDGEGKSEEGGRIGLVGVRLAGRNAHHNRVEYNRMYNLFAHQENSDAGQMTGGTHHNLWAHNYMGAACDDGMDMIGGGHHNIIEYNQFCYAGFDYTGTFSTHPESNGRGFKTNYDAYDNIIRFNIAYSNRTAGFSNEDAGIGNVFYNNTTFGNGENGFTAFTDAIFINNVSVAEGGEFPSKWKELNRIGRINDGLNWFVDPSRYDFHPKAGSPLIDAGRTRISGKIEISQFQGDAPDMGAYEFGAATPGAEPGLLNSAGD
ncbi:right-handed parallel beta-helix repeat-containing protein [candidate division KSB1 bacterium]